MKRTGLIRLGGLAAMVGGVAFVAGQVESEFLGLGTLAGALLVLGAMAAVAALHALQRTHYGLPGALASLAAFVGLVMLFVWLIETFMENSDMPLPPLLVSLYFFYNPFFGVSVATTGIIALAAVTRVTGMLPWWCVAALIAGSPLISVLLMLFSALLLGEWGRGDFLLAVPWIVVGSAVFRAATRQAQQPARVR